MAESLVGREIGQYTVVAKLGRGQHSTVYKAWQSSLERHVALKILHHYDQKTLVGFQEEARLTAQLVQQGVPNIRQVYEVGQTRDGYLYVSLEFVEDSLRNVLARAFERNQRSSPLSVVKILEPIAVALDALHSLGWVHLDIKPQNILISKGGRTVLADFGIAQRRGMQTNACTPVYASPEQAAGDRPVGPWSDIYSLGVVLYEMVAGHPPVRGSQDLVLLTQHLEVTPPSPRRVNSRLTGSQERAIYKALAKSPPDRFRTAGEFMTAMAQSDAFLSSIVKTPTSMLGGTVSDRRPRWLSMLGLTLVVLLIALVVVIWALWPRSPSGLADPTLTAMPTVRTTVADPTSTVTSLPSATITAVPPTATDRPTATLAPTHTNTPRPSPTDTSEPEPVGTQSP
jgi:serine/threonine protein kinase